MQNEQTDRMVPRLAATVMLVRDRAGGGIDTYMARRSARSTFMPDAYVFPGGALEPGDVEPAVLARLDGPPPTIAPTFVVAAIRELFEEAGILLARGRDGSLLDAAGVAAATEAARGTTFAQMLERCGLRLAGDELAYYSNWITPPVEVARRFDAHFFVALAPAGQIAVADAVELHDGLWLAPAEALARGERGEIALVYPTVKHLERLAKFDDTAALLTHARERRPFPVMPGVTAAGEIFMPPETEAW